MESHFASRFPHHNHLECDKASTAVAAAVTVGLEGAPLKIKSKLSESSSGNAFNSSDCSLNEGVSALTVHSGSSVTSNPNPSPGCPAKSPWIGGGLTERSPAAAATQTTIPHSNVSLSNYSNENNSADPLQTKPTPPQATQPNPQPQLKQPQQRTELRTNPPPPPPTRMSPQKMGLLEGCATKSNNSCSSSSCSSNNTTSPCPTVGGGATKKMPALNAHHQRRLLHAKAQSIDASDVQRIGKNLSLSEEEQEQEAEQERESETSPSVCDIEDKRRDLSSLHGMISKIRSLDSGSGSGSRQNSPSNVLYSPLGSPYGSPRSYRRTTRPPLKESRCISIEQSGSFLQLNQYKLLDQIGQGSYGLVKLAYSEEDATHYAMKILSKKKLLRRAGLMGRGPKKTISPLDRVYREIAVLKKLDHPNIVKLVEVLDDPIDDSLYLVFELVKQGEVLRIPTDKPFKEERAWCVFRDVLLGLEYLHYQRIIHGDIKPGNLLLGECGQVKIADLGVCNEFIGEDASMNNGCSSGTPAFRAPETLKLGDHSYSGKASDIWALGATLFALVYGNVPFLAGNIPALYEKIKTDPVHFPPSSMPHSAELKDLILRMLDKDPDTRIRLEEIKAHNWVTADQNYPMPSEEENCRLIQVTEEELSHVVTSIPKLDTLILIKTMLKKHSFQNPFLKPQRTSQRGMARLERFRSGRSNSAPGAYATLQKQFSTETCLPSVIEGCVSESFNGGEGEGGVEASVDPLEASTVVVIDEAEEERLENGEESSSAASRR